MQAVYFWVLISLRKWHTQQNSSEYKSAYERRMKNTDMELQSACKIKKEYWVVGMQKKKLKKK